MKKLQVAGGRTSLGAGLRSVISSSHVMLGSTQEHVAVALVDCIVILFDQ